MAKIIQLQGIPGSGKSTEARRIVRDDHTFKRVNRDEIRGLVDAGDWRGDETEVHVVALEKIIADYFLTHGFNLVVDDTGLSETQKQTWIDMADYHNAELEVRAMSTTLEECIKRDNKRANGVGEAVIRDFWQRYMEAVD